MARITPRSSAASQTPFVPAMGSCAAVGRRWCTLLAVSLVLCLASPSWGQVEEMVRGVERATSLLGEKFLEIRRDVLGADTLAAEYERVGFDYSPMDIPDAIKYDVTDSAMGRISAVLDMMTNVTSDSTSDSAIPSSCCEGSSRSEVCCHGCGSITGDPLLSAVSDSLSTHPAMADIRTELEFGHVDGTLLRFPTPQPTSKCTLEHSHLQPWYISMMRTRPLEVVLVVDLMDLRRNEADTAALRSAALAVLNSLTRQDKVQVVLVGAQVLRFNDETGGEKVLPACASYLDLLRDFIRRSSPPTLSGEPAAYTQAFRVAFNFFYADNDTDKTVIFLSSITNLYTKPTDLSAFDLVLADVTLLNQARGNSVVISAYYNGADDGFSNILRLNTLVTQSTPGVLKKLESEYDVRTYYDVFTNGSIQQQLHIGRDINSRGDPSLSLKLALMNGTEFLGLFRALLPWEMLFSPIQGHLGDDRGTSHFFVVTGDGDGNVLYHPLVPGDFPSTVSVGSLESQDLLSKLVRSPGRASEFGMLTTKQSLTPVSVRGEDENSFVAREVQITYHCRHLSISVVALYVCVGLTDEDAAPAQLKDIDIESLYSDNPDRMPLYHTSEIPDDEKCFYFCSDSAKGQVSIQLTSPSNPPADVKLHQIVSFLHGNNQTATTWADASVANELGVASVIGNVWRNGRSNLTDFVIRRHLATPSGLYLSYPFSQLNADFVARATEWFVFSAAHPHNLTLTLTPPRPHTQWGVGHIVSVATAISAPAKDEGVGEGGLLSVVAADLTLTSLRALVEESLPLCSQNEYNCFLLDDQGHLVYHELLLTSSYQTHLSEPIFFVQSQAPPEFREMIVSILNESVAYKLRCIDYLNQTVRQRLFFSFDLSNNETHAVSRNFIQYAIQKIPGTNVFLGVIRKTREIIPFSCFCTKSCQTCGGNERGGCECPCQCPEDCITPHSFPACPATSLESDQLTPDTSVSPVTLKSDFCLPLDCSCRTENNCSASRDCHWCTELRVCRHLSECCSSYDDPVTCCNQSPFTQLPTCMRSVCTATDIEPPKRYCVEEVQGSTGDNDITASIVGGVLGALLVLFLVLIGAAFILWAKFCKKGLYEDEQKENNFDFSNSKPKAKNPLNEEQAKEELEGTSLEERGGGSQDDILEKPASPGDTTPV